MQFKKITTFLLGALTALSCAIGIANGANASNLLSGVAIGGSYKGSSVLLPFDPVFAAFNYPTYLVNSLKFGKVGSGWNLPAIDSGNNILPDVGNLTEFDFYYDVPNLGPSADPGLNVVIQTSDGFSRIANVVSTPYQTANGYNGYQVQLFPNNFSPSFSVNQTVLRTASIRYNGSVGPIYLYYPVVSGSNTLVYYPDFSFKTTPDPRFNNQ